MAYEFACSNVVPGCGGKVSGETKEDVLEDAAGHAAEVHGLTELSDDVVEAVKGAIVPAG